MSTSNKDSHQHKSEGPVHSGKKGGKSQSHDQSNSISKQTTSKVLDGKDAIRKAPLKRTNSAPLEDSSNGEHYRYQPQKTQHTFNMNNPEKSSQGQREGSGSVLTAQAGDTNAEKAVTAENNHSAQSKISRNPGGSGPPAHQNKSNQNSVERGERGNFHDKRQNNSGGNRRYRGEGNQSGQQNIGYNNNYRNNQNSRQNNNQHQWNNYNDQNEHFVRNQYNPNVVNQHVYGGQTYNGMVQNMPQGMNVSPQGIIFQQPLGTQTRYSNPQVFVPQGAYNNVQLGVGATADQIEVGVMNQSVSVDNQHVAGQYQQMNPNQYYMNQMYVMPSGQVYPAQLQGSYPQVGIPVMQSYQQNSSNNTGNYSEKSGTGSEVTPTPTEQKYTRQPRKQKYSIKNAKGEAIEIDSLRKEEPKPIVSNPSSSSTNEESTSTSSVTTASVMETTSVIADDGANSKKILDTEQGDSKVVASQNNYGKFSKPSQINEFVPSIPVSIKSADMNIALTSVPVTKVPVAPVALPVSSPSVPVSLPLSALTKKDVPVSLPVSLPVSAPTKKEVPVSVPVSVVPVSLPVSAPKKKNESEFTTTNTPIISSVGVSVSSNFGNTENDKIPKVTKASSNDTGKAGIDNKDSTIITPVRNLNDKSNPEASVEGNNNLIDKIDSASKIETTPASGGRSLRPRGDASDTTSSGGRSLRPGGSKMGSKSNVLANVKKYTKDELIILKPDNLSSVARHNMYKNIITLSMDGKPISESSKDGRYYGGSGADGKQWGKKDLSGNRMDRDRHTGNRENRDYWSRDQQLPPAPKSQKQHNPFPKTQIKKAIASSIDKLQVEVLAMLNKITPQTFEKLAQKFLLLDITSTEHLSKLISLIFEKAVQEQTFTSTYAELCSHLNKNSSVWSFVHIIKSFETKEYFWVKDFVFDKAVAGPFSSVNDYLAVVPDSIPHMFIEDSKTLKEQEIILYKNYLLKVYATAQSEYFVTYYPIDKIDANNKGDNFYQDENAARKEVKSKTDFRYLLINSCQKEFQNQLQDSKYASLENQKIALVEQGKKTKDKEKADEIMMQILETDDELGKMKRRMLGNTRFVGELYKQGLLITGTMHNCIQELIGVKGKWKELKEDQEIECLCRLITTVGELLHSKSLYNTDYSLAFDSYFERMNEMTKDKSINSRMRFAIEEVINLRKSNWKARKEKEGPVKLSELQNKIAEEERRQQQPPQYQIQSQKNSFPNTHSPQNNITANVRNSASRAKGHHANNNNRQTGKVDSSPMSAAKFETDRTMVKSKVTSTVKEYLRDEDLKELEMSLESAPSIYFLELIAKIIAIVVEDPSPVVLKKLISLIESKVVSKNLKTNKGGITSTLGKLDEIKAMPDFICDNRETPERIGAIVGALVKFEACSVNSLKSTVEILKKECKADGIYNPEEVDTVYGRFLASFTA